MNIAIIGWGSLIWRPDTLSMIGEWQKDGPFLPIEFARISRDNRLTLVLRKNSTPIQTLWCRSAFEDLDEARQNLGEREETSNLTSIGFTNLVNGNQSLQHTFVSKEINQWVQEKKLDAAIWTDLGANFEKKIKMKLTLENILFYLNSLSKGELFRAKEYILNAPTQIGTDLRVHIATRMHWL